MGTHTASSHRSASALPLLLRHLRPPQWRVRQRPARGRSQRPDPVHGAQGRPEVETRRCKRRVSSSATPGSKTPVIASCKAPDALPRPETVSFRPV
jgi:hypothetical protein